MKLESEKHTLSYHNSVLTYTCVLPLTNIRSNLFDHFLQNPFQWSFRSFRLLGLHSQPSRALCSTNKVRRKKRGNRVVHVVRVVSVAMLNFSPSLSVSVSLFPLSLPPPPSPLLSPCFPVSQSTALAHFSGWPFRVS